jgi:rhodanese-related sulfurtransferase
MAGEAAELLRKKGFRVQRLEDGVAEWRFHGLPLSPAGAAP